MISIFQNHLGVYKDVVGNGGNMVLLIPSVVFPFLESKSCAELSPSLSHLYGIFFQSFPTADWKKNGRNVVWWWVAAATCYGSLRIPCIKLLD